MINIRKEQKITIPQKYLEYLEPNYIFIPIKENKNYPKTIIKAGDLIADVTSPITGNILATAVNNEKRYLIIKNNKLDETKDEGKNLEEIELKVSKNNDKKEEAIKYLENKETIYINVFDKDVLTFNNYYIFLKEKDKIIFVLNYFLNNARLKEIYLVIPATYEDVINEYKKIKNKKIKLIIVNDYFALGYNDILSKYLRINRDNIISTKDLLNVYYDIRKENNNYIYLTVRNNIETLVVKVTKYTILKELLEYLKIDITDIKISLNNSLINIPIDIQYVLTEKTELIILNKKEEIESKKNMDNCSNCGLCYTMCPWHINPLKTSKCCNCGLCNYVCPSKRKLRVGDSSG